jgi:hypothetical protein
MELCHEVICRYVIDFIVFYGGQEISVRFDHWKIPIYGSDYTTTVLSKKQGKIPLWVKYGMPCWGCLIDNCIGCSAIFRLALHHQVFWGI